MFLRMCMPELVWKYFVHMTLCTCGVHARPRSIAYQSNVSAVVCMRDAWMCAQRAYYLFSVLREGQCKTVSIYRYYAKPWLPLVHFWYRIEFWVRKKKVAPPPVRPEKRFHHTSASELDRAVSRRCFCSSSDHNYLKLFDDCSPYDCFFIRRRFTFFSLVLAQDSPHSNNMFGKDSLVSLETYGEDSHRSL